MFQLNYSPDLVPDQIHLHAKNIAMNGTKMAMIVLIILCFPAPRNTASAPIIGSIARINLTALIPHLITEVIARSAINPIIAQ